jgi:hypothetical protein
MMALTLKKEQRLERVGLVGYFRIIESLGPRPPRMHTDTSERASRGRSFAWMMSYRL